MSMRPPRKDNLRKSWPSPSSPHKYRDFGTDGKVIVTKLGYRNNIDHVDLMTMYKAHYIFIIDDWNDFETDENFWAEDVWPKTMTVVKDRSGEFSSGGTLYGDERPKVEITRNDFMKLLLAA